jgi:hypothetical protein
MDQSVRSDESRRSSEFGGGFRIPRRDAGNKNRK